MTKMQEKQDTINMIGVILAGGKSTRMNGTNKALLKLNDKALIEHAIDRLKPDLDTIVINANEKLDAFYKFNLPVIKDTIADFAGPLAGILSAMQWAKANEPTTTHILSVAADTPFFPNEYAEKMRAAIAHNSTNLNQIALVQDGDFWHPTFGLWPINLSDELERFLKGDIKKVMAFVKQHELINVEFESTLNYDPFFNINTRQDLEKANIFLRANR